MKKLSIILIIMVVIVILLYAFAFPYSINQTLNSNIAGKPDKNCNIDSDCTLKQIGCRPCECFDVVNIEWNSFCPLKNPGIARFQCKMCASEGIDFDVKCVENQCQKVWR
ncbi:MAG TPA: hypothetical protein VJH20_02725 [Candidatus Nanoarchaeia archaeon]|nr:hypothetical protein [Candidatus Nanoarchaeia archaeon]